VQWPSLIHSPLGSIVPLLKPTKLHVQIAQRGGGQALAISHPIDGDQNVEDAFVQFLGGRRYFLDCCKDSNIIDGTDGNGLTAADRLAIWIYSNFTSSWYAQLNSDLWSGKPSPATTAFARILNNAINKLPAHVGSVYRGIESRDLDALLAIHHYGATVAWPGFTSSTLDRGEAYEGDVLFIIQSHTGRRLGLYAHNHTEREVLFPAGTRFHITFVQRDDDSATIEMEEVTEP
jgi:NAD:arginine ADP-ribosyltransferase